MHHRSHAGRSATHLLLLFTVTLLVVAAAAVVPAAAAPTPTTLRVTAQSPSVSWGATAILNGVLQTLAAPPLPVDRQQVLVQYSTASIGPWTTTPDSPITNTAAPYSSGAYTYSWSAERNYYWRMDFAGDSAWAPITSNVLYVKVKPVLGKPACPSSVRHGTRFTVSGSLKPRYTAGSRNVTLKAQRYARGNWRGYRTYAATTADSGAYSRFSARISIPRVGTYRFIATTAGTPTLSAGKSTHSRSMRVR